MPDSESGPWVPTPALPPSSFEKYHCPTPAVVALPVANLHLRPVVVAHIKWSWRRASRLGWGRMYQMNGYELVKVHGEGQYPFTYRGENGVLLGDFGKNTYFSLIFHKIRVEKLVTITSLSRYSCFPRCIFSYCPTPMSFLPRNLTGALPRSYPRKVVSHFLAGMHLSSCTVSHRQYSFSQFGAKQKHRKMPTTQAEFLLSEGKPLTVLGQSQ